MLREEQLRHLYERLWGSDLLEVINTFERLIRIEGDKAFD